MREISFGIFSKTPSCLFGICVCQHVLVISLVSLFVLGARLETIYKDRFYLKL